MHVAVAIGEGDRRVQMYDGLALPPTWYVQAAPPLSRHITCSVTPSLAHTMADERAELQEASAPLEDDVALLEEEEGSKGLDDFEESVGKAGEALGEEDLLKDSDPDVVALAEADDLLEGTEGEQFEVL